MSDVEYKIEYSEHHEVERHNQAGEAEYVKGAPWALIELYHGEVHAVWYFNTPTEAEEFKEDKIAVEQLKEELKQLKNSPPSETESTKTSTDRHTDFSEVDDKGYNTEIYGRITIKTKPLNKNDKCVVLITADKHDYLFSHYSCSEEVKDEVVGLAIRIAKVLQNLGGYDWRNLK